MTQTCHDIGISGNCGLDCEVLLQGNCDEYTKFLEYLIERNKDLTKYLRAASQALISYQYGNSSPDLAKSVAQECEFVLLEGE